MVSQNLMSKSKQPNLKESMDTTPTDILVTQFNELKRLTSLSDNLLKLPQSGWRDRLLTSVQDVLDGQNHVLSEQAQKEQYAKCYTAYVSSHAKVVECRARLRAIRTIATPLSLIKAGVTRDELYDKLVFGMRRLLEHCGTEG